jgi:poly-beta-1,6 N-acetyl-D-glucosamine export porin PgaA
MINIVNAVKKYYFCAIKKARKQSNADLTKDACQSHASSVIHLLMACLLLSPLWLQRAHADTAREHDAAIIAARKGELDEALTVLARLENSSADPRVRHDLIVVFGWAGRHQQAVRVWERMGWKTDLPDYVRLGLVGSLNALAGEAERRKERFETLRYLGQALQLANPSGSSRVPHADAERMELAAIRLMGELGGHQGALWRSASPALQQRADGAALRLRLAKHLGNSVGSEHKTRLDEITAELSSVIAEVKLAAQPDKRLLHQLLGDRAVAHVELRLWAKALEDVDATAALGLPLWPHVQMAQGAVLLGLQRPVLARPVYEAVLQAEPDNVAARWGLFYALADQGLYDPATAVMDATATERFQRIGLEGRTEQDPDWLSARLASARVRSWDNQHEAAWQRLSAMRNAMPDDAGIRSALSSVAAARGWPRLAEQEARAAHTLDESNPDVQLALAESALRRHQWAELRHRMGLLEGLESNQRDVLARDVALTQGWRVASGHVWRAEPGSAGGQTGESRSTTVRLDAPLVLDGWRPIAKAEHIQGMTPGVFDATRRRAGLGLQYEGSDNVFELMAVQETGPRSGPSMSFGARHAFNDQWTVAAGIASRTADAPLRAYANGIDVDTTYVNLNYSRDEALAAALGWQAYRFSDGNQRFSGSAALTQQLYASSVWRIATRQEVYASRNSSNAGPYFSPLRDFSVSLALISERVWLRTSQRNWSDRLALQAGKYHQMGYPVQTVSAVSYEQTYSPSPALELSAGVTHSLRYYDGTPQRANEGQLRMVVRF